MTQKITALKAQQRNPGRVSVYLDGEFAFGLARIVAAWLTVGQELTEQQIRELKAKDEVEVAMLRALNFLSRRPRSEQEVRRALQKKGIPETVEEQVIASLRESAMVDDARFAGVWVENRTEFRPRGSRALRMELRQKGVQDSEIDRALEGLDEEWLALQAGRKQVRRYRGLEYDEFRRKIYGFLARRGFDYETIRSVAPIVWEELQSIRMADNTGPSEVDP
jgi:regulatory protein